MSGLRFWKSIVSALFLPFSPCSGGPEGTWQIQKTLEKGLFPQISSDLLKPPSLKPPFAALQKTHAKTCGENFGAFFRTRNHVLVSTSFCRSAALILWHRIPTIFGSLLLTTKGLKANQSTATNFAPAILQKCVGGFLMYKIWRIFAGTFLEDFSGHFFPQK